MTANASIRSRSEASVRLRFIGEFNALSAKDRRALLERRAVADDRVRDAVAKIIADVRRRGDTALLELAQRFDGVPLERVEIPSACMARALDGLDSALRAAMERTARNIEVVHRASMPTLVEVEPEPGVIVGRRPDPLTRVGVYAPGGRAVYPSSVLMGVIPARVAGVREIVLCSPPGLGGFPSDPILAAASLAGVDRVFAIGGAGAVAAMAFGTESVPRVDRIVGPGNAYVAAAKLAVAGEVSIDSPAGPSELLVIADAGADPAGVALEVVAQAEHDPDACVVVAAVGQTVAAATEAAIAELVAGTARRAIVERALERQSGVLWFSNIGAAVAFANDYAPEHLLLAVDEPDEALAKVRSAGTVFMGETSSVAFGDYMTGANHVLPTGGSARSYSGLSTLDFVRWTTYQRIDRAAARSLSVDTGTFAEAEGLPGHAAAARRWRTVA